MDLFKQENTVNNLLPSDNFLVHPLLKKEFSWNLFTVVDSAKYWLEAQIEILLKTIVVLLSFFKNAKMPTNYTGCIRGVSSSEIPTSKISLNCFWMGDEKVLPQEENYFYLADRGFKSKALSSTVPYAVFTHFDLLNSLSYHAKFDVALILTGQFLKNFLGFNLVDYFLSKSIYKTFVWKHFALQNKLKWIISSISENGPSPVELEVLNHHSIKTILWSYSYYGFRPSHIKKFNNQSLLMALAHHQYILMWDKEVNNLFASSDIAVFDDPLPKYYFETGPLLNGRMDHLSLNQKQALENLGLDIKKDYFYISIFDLVAWKKQYRLAAAIEPYMTADSQDKFYEQLLQLLIEIPNIIFLFKPKRGLSKILHLPKTRQEILDKKLHYSISDRIVILDENTDPQLVIKASNCVITSFFTSPSAIAIALNMPNVYFEPSLKYTQIASEKIQNSYIGDYQTLKNKILMWQQDPTPSTFDYGSYKENLKKILNSILMGPS